MGAEICFGALALRTGGAISGALLLAAAAFGFYALAVAAARRAGGSSWLSPRVILLFAALFRITLLVSPPMFSDDLYRYVWDGRIQSNGINPFKYPPSAPELAEFRDGGFDGINHPDVPTIYPPLSQDLFLGAVLVSPSVPMMKAAIVLCEFLGLLLLWNLLKTLRGPPVSLLLYAWNPLVVIEVAGNGHCDPLGVTCLLLAVQLILLNRSRLSIAALGASVAAKWVSAAFLPFFLAAPGHRPWYSRLAARSAAFLGTLGFLYLPYVSAGWGLFNGLREYSDRWRQNDFGFSLLVGIFERLELTELLKRGIGRLPNLSGDSILARYLYRHSYPLDLAKLAAAAILGALAVYLLWRCREIPRQIFWMTGGILLLAPTLHPWYLLWILPFAAIYRSSAWMLFSALVLISYLPGESTAEGVTLLRWVEYLPLYGLLAFEAFRSRRKIERPAEGVIASPQGSTAR